MITDIHLVNFRSYADDSIEVSPNVNIVVGPNASGKTNLLEAVLVISRGFSYRAKDLELISFNKPWAKLEAHTEDFDRVVKIERLENDKAAKIFNINTKETKRLSLDQSIPVVLFEPNHLIMLIGVPELRRNYIDDILEQTTPGFKALRAQYKRTLSQRNMLLKSHKPSKQNLFVWNIRISELGGKIYKERVALIDKLHNDLATIYQDVSGGKELISLTYETPCRSNSYETDLLHKLESNLEKDLERGFTSYGPHRDNINVFINKRPASEVASRGETRTVLLALKILEAKFIEAQRSKKPVLLFDDVFSELDGSRRLALTKLLKDNQAFITTTDADLVIKHFTQTSNIIPIKPQNNR
jgi:DNA replication and repair protein RecF